MITVINYNCNVFIVQFGSWLCNLSPNFQQGDQKNRKNICQFFFQKIAQKVAKSKKAKISTTKLNLKAQNIYNNCFWNLIPTTNHALKLLIYVKNLINLLKQKVAITLGYFILSKNHNEPQKVAQLAKNHPIWSPWLCPITYCFMWYLLPSD